MCVSVRAPNMVCGAATLLEYGGVEQKSRLTTVGAPAARGGGEEGGGVSYIE